MSVGCAREPPCLGSPSPASPSSRRLAGGLSAIPADADGQPRRGRRPRQPRAEALPDPGAAAPAAARASHARRRPRRHPPRRDLTLALRDLRLRAGRALGRRPSATAPRCSTRPSGRRRPATSATCGCTGQPATRRRAADYVDEVGSVVTPRAGDVRAPRATARPSPTAPAAAAAACSTSTSGPRPPASTATATPTPRRRRSGPYDTCGLLRLRQRLLGVPAHTPLENLEVTAAHELFHAVQFAYDYDEDAWFMEATATWAEDEVYTRRQRQPAVPRREPADASRGSRWTSSSGRPAVRRLDLLPLPHRAVPAQVGRPARLIARRSGSGPTAPRRGPDDVLHPGGQHELKPPAAPTLPQGVRRVRRRQPAPRRRRYREGAATPTPPRRSAGDLER